MSVFSDLLSEYITMKDVGVYPLSQFCGLDRSSMYKIINGKRKPAGEDVVRKMAQFMQLTPQEMGTVSRLLNLKQTCPISPQEVQDCIQLLQTHLVQALDSDAALLELVAQKKKKNQAWQ